MGNVFDVFNDDAFSVVSLTDSINKVPFVPGRLGRLGLFEPRSVATTQVMLEEKNGLIRLIPNTPRGASGTQNQTEKRKARSLVVPHLPQEDKILADEIQGVRMFGSDNQLETIQNVVAQRQATMSRNLDATLENLRVGSIKGIIYDSDGSTVIYNLFTEFGVSQISEIDFDLDAGSPASGVLRKKCTDVERKIATELGGAPYSGIHCMCGDAFWDDLIAHPEVRETYLGQQEASELRNGVAYATFNFGGITFENYRGYIGSTAYIHTDKAHFFPVGVPGLFLNYFAPADYMETANTLGLPKYMKQAADHRFNKFVDLEAQSNPLPICTRPRVLIQAKRT
jgi:hypothetical protein